MELEKLRLTWKDSIKLESYYWSRKGHYKLESQLETFQPKQYYPTSDETDDQTSFGCFQLKQKISNLRLSIGKFPN